LAGAETWCVRRTSASNACAAASGCSVATSGKTLRPLNGIVVAFVKGRVGEATVGRT